MDKQYFGWYFWNLSSVHVNVHSHRSSSDSRGCSTLFPRVETRGCNASGNHFIWKSYWLLRHFQYFPIAFHFQILGNRNFNPEFPPENFSCCRARHQRVILTRVCRQPIVLHALTPSHSTSSVIYHVWLLYKLPQSFARYVFLQRRWEKVLFWFSYFVFSFQSIFLLIFLCFKMALFYQQ